MMIEREWFVISTGRDIMRRARWSVFIGIGRNPHADEGTIPWRHIWEWSTARLPSLVWDGRRVIGVKRLLGRNYFWR